MIKTVEGKQLEKLYIIKKGIKVTIWEDRLKAKELYDRIMDIDRFIVDASKEYTFDVCVACKKSKTNEYCCNACIYCLDIYFDTDISDDGIRLGVKHSNGDLLESYRYLMGISLTKKKYKKLIKIMDGMQWLLEELEELLGSMEQKIELIFEYTGERWGF